MLKAVIYDMDGVLIDSEPLWRRGAAEYFHSMGIPYRDEMGIETMGVRIDRAVEIWHGKLNWDEKKLSFAFVERGVMNNVEKLVIKYGKAKEGAVNSLKFFHGQKLKVALASSAHLRVIKTILDTLKIGYYFEIIHSSELEKHAKPAPDVYLTTAKLLKLNPAECLVIEDSPVGVASAKNAGMTCIAMPSDENKEDPDVKRANLFINSMNEINSGLWEKLKI